jgi:hypothetical protein
MTNSNPLLVPIYKHTHLTAYALVSPEDAWVLDLSWTLHKAGYAMCCSSGPKDVLMHRAVAKPSSSAVVDHINGNRLDNRRENLRNCTQAENARNTRRIVNKSGARGVVFDMRDQKWAAAIGFQGRRIHLGRYDSPEEAGQAYDSAARQLHGEFAVLNYPEISKFTDVDWPAEIIARETGAKRTKRITYQIAGEIRERAATGESPSQLAAAFQVCAATISNIVNHKSHRSEAVLPVLGAALEEVSKGRAVHLVAKEFKVGTVTLREAVKARWGDNPPSIVYKRREGAKLSAQDVVDILARVANGEMQKTLATEYGVTAATINGYVKHRVR